MTSHVHSADGTRIAFDRLGEGPSLIVVSGIFCTRNTTAELAEQLAERFTVVNYDRRGRGESGSGATPDPVAREIEDLHALIDAVGGTATVYGHSSGAGLALRAAAAGLAIDRLVLHEPPYGPDDPESVEGTRAMAEGIRTALAEDRRSDAIALFLADMGLPPEALEATSHDPDMLAVAPTMLHDLEVMGDFEGGTIPEDLVRGVTVPALVLAGGASPDFFRDTASRIAELLPHGELTVLDGQDHGAPPEVVAPVVADFVLGASGTR